MKTVFDEDPATKALYEKLWLSRGDSEFWTFLELCDTRVKVCPGATDKSIAQLKKFVRGEIPTDLENFLHRSNGLFFDFDQIVYSVEGIIEDTRSMHQSKYFLPNKHLLFIGAFGDGDAFVYAKDKSGEWRHDVYWWEHETESCYDCGLGIFDYVAKHVSWRHADQPQLDHAAQEKQQYEEILQKLSGDKDPIKGLRRLVNQILKSRAKRDLAELTATALFREFLSQLSGEDFRKIPIERLIQKP
jgi:hypothetical protein